ncbi:adenylosuccinate lyase [Candidatus Woesearchaeota archaeon]|nr:adenylosuccinate lyase [Candidatus Woesearchaeota archaeon]
MNKFDAISPLDYRYYSDELKPYLSEEAAIRYQIKVEAALAKTLADNGICSQKAADEIEQAARSITAAEVYEEEQRIKHNIRALVNCIQRKVSDEAKPFVHLTATSNDIISTAEALRIKDACEQVLLPELAALEKTLIEIAEREKETAQIGRTHGQHAEPITFGFTIASYISRLGGRILKIREAAANLRGKFSGAVGAYNASSLIIRNPEEFEAAILKKLSLKPGSHSTQLVEAEYTADLMHAIISAMGVMANVADDMRHLQRSEIAEVYEEFGAQQVGSSTMPHKRNPINFENVKSMWKAIMPRMNTVYMDQISEHQRDLTNSASSRFNTEIVAAAYTAAKKLKKTMKNLAVDKESLRKNISSSAAAEPAYIMLAALGHPDAHEAVRKITLSGKDFLQQLMADKELKPYLAKMTQQQIETLKNPEKYTGIAAAKTQKVCDEWKSKI